MDPSYPIKNEVATAMVGLMSILLVTYTFHCTWVTSEAYSSPSIVLSAKQHDGSRVIFDDFREAYYWLRQNTPEVMYLSVCCQLDNSSSNQSWNMYHSSAGIKSASNIFVVVFVSGCKSDVLVGLWLSNHCYGQPNYTSGQ